MSDEKENTSTLDSGQWEYPTIEDLRRVLPADNSFLMDVEALIKRREETIRCGQAGVVPISGSQCDDYPIGRISPEQDDKDGRQGENPDEKTPSGNETEVAPRSPAQSDLV